LKTQNAGDIFTLTFDGERVSGVAAPNRYSSPYELGEGKKITIKMGISTRMASIFEPERLREQDFLTYIQNTYEWNLVDNKLELFSKNENDEKVRLVFSL
jgi:heat shock protein HslJ